ncbi:MAG: hypothetical protein WA005_11325 [Candidatus Binataceae bacterium]
MWRPIAHPESEAEIAEAARLSIEAFASAAMVARSSATAIGKM